MSHVTHIDSAEIIIRSARSEDYARIARVAGRDTGAAPQGPMLVAEVGGDVRAAISLAEGSIVADPFHRTTELVEMLKIRAAAIGHNSSQHAGRTRRPRRGLALTRAA